MFLPLLQPYSFSARLSFPTHTRFLNLTSLSAHLYERLEPSRSVQPDASTTTCLLQQLACFNDFSSAAGVRLHSLAR
jgi:hypothetical protein